VINDRRDVAALLIPMNVTQLTPMSCTLACFEAFSAQNGGSVTQRDIILGYPHYCQGNEPQPGYVLIQDYTAVAALFGIPCQPINPHPLLLLPHHPRRAILIGAGNYHGHQHSLLWIRALSLDRGLAMNPNETITKYLKFNLQDLNQWDCLFWKLEA
jgi:hypothetical protein